MAFVFLVLFTLGYVLLVRYISNELKRTNLSTRIFTTAAVAAS